MYSSRVLGVALGVGIAALPAAAETTTDTFEHGRNLGGWVISGNPGIDPSGGNPGAWLHNPLADVFAPIVRTTVPGNPFVGDFRSMGVTTISFDATLIDRDWGNPNGYEMSILLRDTKGTAPVDDDDYAYFVGPNVPLIGAGWVHYEFDIPSADTSSVPPGWHGGWAGDLESFRPGVDWNDVVTSIDQVEIWWLNPAFSAIFAQWDCGMDNISITAEAAVDCPADTDGDGVVGITDLLDLLAAWGGSDPAYDLNGDGVVGVLDFLEMLAAWGPCL